MSKKEKKVSPLKGSNWWGVLMFLILLLIDMLTKFAADAYFSQHPGKRIEVVPNWIWLCITHNRGIAYGAGEDASEWLKIGVVASTGALMVILAAAYFLMDKNRTWIRWAIVFIVAGGIGNFIDRVYYQVWIPDGAWGVRDMVDLNKFGFAVCNFADFFICGGAAALMAALLFFDEDAMIPLGKYKQLAVEKERVRAEKKANRVKKKNG